MRLPSSAILSQLAAIIEVAASILRRFSRTGDPPGFVSEETKLAERADKLAEDIEKRAEPRH